jgi:hypothetical protein
VTGFTNEEIKKYRRWVVWFSVACFLVALFLALFGERFPWLQKEIRTETIVAFASLVVAVTTFLGFLLTMIMKMVKESRESKHGRIELEKKELELEKLRREVGDRNSAAQKKKKPTKRRRVD